MKKLPVDFKIESIRANSHRISFTGVKKGWEQWVMLSSDRHHDNMQARWDLEKAHLEKARERRALILDFGDMFCAMQGKYDPRSSMDSLRPEHKRGDYLDALVSTAEKFYAPYAGQFALIGRGNHETNIRTRHGVDLTERLVDRLKDKHGARVNAGEYSGWVIFSFVMHRTVWHSRVLYYFHGSGGGGPVTRGTIQSNRMAVNYPDADMVVSGHTHDNWILPIKRKRIIATGLPYDDLAWHIRTPTYKDEHDKGSGWAVERGINPKPLGCVWVRFYYEATRRDKGRVLFEVMPEVV